ncbi:MAG: glycosyltransferase [Bacteroidetes bacterium]|nr:glycosyltransferase [Bacteroidota bacterium]
MIVLTVFFWLIGIYLFFYSFYWFLTVLLGSFYRYHDPRQIISPKAIEYLFILPAYKPNSLFLKVIESVKVAAGENRIHQIFSLLQEPTEDMVKQVGQAGIHVRNKSFSHFTGNPYHYALEFIISEIESGIKEGKWNPTHIVLLDKDNVLSSDFMDKIEPGVLGGYDLVQGKRLPFTTYNAAQSFDTIAESLNDIQFRAAKSCAGLGLEVSGSGLVMKYELFRSAILSLDKRSPGMDKNLMVNLHKMGFSSLYVPTATLFEEKTDDMEIMQAQRTRWLGEQYYNGMNYGPELIWIGLKEFRLSPIDFAVSILRPPRSVHVLLMPVLALAEMTDYIVGNSIFPTVPFFTLGTILLFLSVVIFALATHSVHHLLRIIFKLPLFAIKNVSASFSGVSKKNRGKFIHTERKVGE